MVSYIATYTVIMIYMIAKNLKHKSFTLGLATIAALFAVLSPASVWASTQSFNVTDKNTQQGMLMSVSVNTKIVVPATSNNASSLIGVAVKDQANLSATNGQISVQTDGLADTLVSTVNGDIELGDRIAPSSLLGVGAKAEGSGWIIGTAQSTLNSKTSGAVPTTVTDSSGKKQRVYVARIPVIVKPTYYSTPGAQQYDDTILPDSIQATANKIAGKQVKPIAIIVSALLMIAGAVLAVQLINGAIKNGFAAIARQPLAKIIILRKVLQTFAVAAGIVALSFFFAFLILKMF